MTITEGNNWDCRLVDDCPLLEDCKSDSEEQPSSCPMKRWSFDELLSGPPRCSECDSLSQFETTHAQELTNQDRRDLSLYWMEHLNRHLERFAESQRVQRTESE
jgi:hypothetical protein